MSKINIFTLVSILLSVLFLNVRHASADLIKLDNCPNPLITKAENSPPTIPSALTSKSENASFEINIGKYYSPSVTKWQIQFECGPDTAIAGQQVVDASVNAELKTITTKKPVDRSQIPFGGCEFFPGSHTIQVKGDGVPRCRGTYTVIDADSQCELSIDPPNGITADTPVKVSGKNLTKGGQFHLYLDDVQVSANYLETSTDFKDQVLPKEKLTPIMHRVYLRRDYATPVITGIKKLVTPLQNYDKGPILCPKEFRVGTTDEPGAVSSSKDQSVSDKCKVDDKDCSKAGGDPCEDDRGPGFKTAIGCIHSTPKAFVEDVLKFATGIGGGLAFMMMLFGAFQMMKSAGNPQSLQEGKDVFTNAIIGILFIIFSILLMKIIGIDILDIPGFS